MSQSTPQPQQIQISQENLHLLTAIARRFFKFSVLHETGSDKIDFKEVASWDAASALQLAFIEGQKSALKTIKNNDANLPKEDQMQTWFGIPSALENDNNSNKIGFKLR
tara:strand:+ start:644 stop:970 length:327 start_codon:yes stop_codon:yes gene_type:complete